MLATGKAVGLWFTSHSLAQAEVERMRTQEQEHQDQPLLPLGQTVIARRQNIKIIIQKKKNL